MAVSDANIEYGALGSDFTLLFMPIKELRITLGLPTYQSFSNYIYNFKYDWGVMDKDGKYTDKTRPIINAGIEYTYDESLCFAFIIRDLLFNKSHYDVNDSYDYPYFETTLVFFTSFNAKKWLNQNLTINAGYTFKADTRTSIYGGAFDYINASIEWKNDFLTLAAQGIFHLSLAEYSKL